MYAADAESYKTFSALFDPIIEDFHGFTSKDKHPDVDLGEGKTSDFSPLDPDGKYILSTRFLLAKFISIIKFFRIRCKRTMKGYPFKPLLNDDGNF